MKLHEVELYAKDIQASREFYRSTVGLELNEGASNPGLNVFAAGDGSWIDFNTSQHGTDDGTIGVSFMVEDIAPIIARLEEENFTFTPPQKDHTGLPSISAVLIRWPIQGPTPSATAAISARPDGVFNLS